MRTVLLSDYATMPGRTLEWLVEGLVPRPGIILLVGEPKVGKSFLALQLGIALAKHTPFLGSRVATGSAVLYIQSDMSELIWRDRFDSLRRQGQTVSGPLYVLHPDDVPNAFNLLNPDHYMQLQAAIERVNASLVIFDVLRDLHSADEQDSTAMKVVMDAIGALTRGRSTVIVHHTSKIGTDYAPRPINASRGSSYLTGKADAIWWLHANSLSIVPRFAAPSSIQLRRDGGGLFVAV